MRVTNEIMESYQHLVSELTLVTGGGGVFDVTVTRDGVDELIYSKHSTGRQANDGEVLAALETLLPADARRYGT